MKNYLPPDSQPWVRWIESQLLQASKDRPVNTKKIILRDAVAPMEELVIKSPTMPEEGVIFEGQTPNVISNTEFRFPFSWSRGNLTGYTARFTATATVPTTGTIVRTYVNNISTPLDEQETFEDAEVLTLFVSVDYPIVNENDTEVLDDFDPETLQDADEATEIHLGNSIIVRATKPGVALSDAKLEILGPSSSSLRFYIGADGRVHSEAIERGVARDLGDVSLDDFDHIVEQAANSGMSEEEKARLEAVAADLAEAKEDLETRMAQAEAAGAEAAQNLATLDGKLNGLEVGLDAVVASVNGKNSVTISTNAPDSTTPGVAVGDVWWRRDAENNVYGQWTWDGSEWVESQVRNEMIADLDVHKLQVTGSATVAEAVINKLWVDGLAARTIETSRFVVAPGNHYRDPNLLEQAGWGSQWEPARGYRGGGSVYVAPGSSQRGAYDYLTFPEGVTYRDLTKVVGGRPYLLGAWLYLDRSASAGGLSFNVRFFDDLGIYLGERNNPIESVPGGVWTQVEVDVSVPIRAAYMAVGCYAQAGFSGAARFSDLSVREKVGAVLIEDGAVTADKLAANSVTSRTLNVVPVSGTGGLKMDSRGLDIIPPREDGAGTYVSLRNDTENAISFAKGDSYTFSVSQEGDLTAQSVSIPENGSLQYRGVELEEFFEGYARGLVQINTMSQDANMNNGDYTRLVYGTIKSPMTPRAYKITVRVSTSAGSANARMHFHLRQSAGINVKNTNSSIKQFYLPKRVEGYAQSIEFSHIVNDTSSSWGRGNDITVGLFGTSLNPGETVLANASWGTEIVFEDIGPAVRDTIPITPFVPGTSYSGIENETGKSIQKRTFSPTWYRSWSNNGSVVYNWKPEFAFHGTSPAGYGVLKSMIGFNASSIAAFCSGAEMVSARVYVKNSHTYSSAGAQVGVGTHGQRSAPATFPGDTYLGNPTFKRGEGRWLGLDQVLASLRTGATCGISFESTAPSVNNYAYFDAAATRLEITVRK